MQGRQCRLTALSESTYSLHRLYRCQRRYDRWLRVRKVCPRRAPAASPTQQLCQAAQSGSLISVMRLLQQGVDANAGTTRGS